MKKILVRIVITAPIFVGNAYANTQTKLPESSPKKEIQSVNSQITGTPAPLTFSQAKQNFEAVRKIILSEHVNSDITEQELYLAATRGMLRALNKNKQDKWNALIEPREFHELKVGLSGKVTGIGVEIRPIKETGTAFISRVLEDSPADKAGLLAGDQILSVNKKTFNNAEIRAMLREIRGPVGQKLALKVLRGDQVLSKNVTRQKVVWDPVIGKLQETGIGHLKIRYFAHSTPTLVKRKLEEFNKAKIKGLIVDLRQNSGGMFERAIETVDFFIPKGNIITRTVSRGNITQLVTSQHDPIIKGVPHIVLIDRGTSSGAELVAASLKQNLGSQIVGERSFGKWNAQMVRMLPNNFAIKFTVRKFMPPNDETHHGHGISPDVRVVNQDFMLPSRQSQEKKGLQKVQFSSGTQMADPQLNKAYHLLKTMI